MYGTVHKEIEDAYLETSRAPQRGPGTFPWQELSLVQERDALYYLAWALCQVQPPIKNKGHVELTCRLLESLQLKLTETACSHPLKQSMCVRKSLWGGECIQGA